VPTNPQISTLLTPEMKLTCDLRDRLTVTVPPEDLVCMALTSLHKILSKDIDGINFLPPAILNGAISDNFISSLPRESLGYRLLSLCYDQFPTDRSTDTNPVPLHKYLKVTMDCINIHLPMLPGREEINDSDSMTEGLNMALDLAAQGLEVTAKSVDQDEKLDARVTLSVKVS